jgi:hypothetical protein
MGLFEENPLLLVPFILIVVISYDLVKWAISRYVSAHGSRRPLS